jgi:NAD(P)H-dependent FMN reductase
VSYGGVSAGTRAANSLKGDLATLRMVPVTDAVNIPFFTQFINDQDEFVPNDITLKASEKMLNELLRWTKGLTAIRENK